MEVSSPSDIVHKSFVGSCVRMYLSQYGLHYVSKGTGSGGVNVLE